MSTSKPVTTSTRSMEIPKILKEDEIKGNKKLQKVTQAFQEHFGDSDFTMMEISIDQLHLLAQRGFTVLGDDAIDTDSFDPSGSIKSQFNAFCGEITHLPELEQQGLLQEYFKGAMKYYLIFDGQPVGAETTFLDFREDCLKQVEEFILYYLPKMRGLGLDLQIKGDFASNGITFFDLTPKGMAYYEKERNKYTLRVGLDYITSMRKGLSFIEVNLIDSRRKSFLIGLENLDYFKTVEAFLKFNKSLNQNLLRLKYREILYRDNVKEKLEEFNANIENTKLICQIAREKKISIHNVSAKLIRQYSLDKEARKKKEAEKALKALCLDETKSQKKKKKKKKKKASSQPQNIEPTIKTEPRPLRIEEGKGSELVKPIIKYHPRVIRWSQITDSNLVKIKDFYDKQDRYASMDEGQLRLQRDEHNVLGIHELFTNFQTLQRYSYAFTTEGNSCRGFYARMINKMSDTTRFGIISVGIDRIKNRIFHVKFDERTGLVSSGKDLISQIETVAPESPTSREEEWQVANKYALEKLANGSICLSYKTGISFEIVPL